MKSWFTMCSTDAQLFLDLNRQCLTVGKHAGCDGCKQTGNDSVQSKIQHEPIRDRGNSGPGLIEMALGDGFCEFDTVVQQISAFFVPDLYETLKNDEHFPAPDDCASAFTGATSPESPSGTGNPSGRVSAACPNSVDASGSRGHTESGLDDDANRDAD